MAAQMAGLMVVQKECLWRDWKMVPMMEWKKVDGSADLLVAWTEQMLAG